MRRYRQTHREEPNDSLSEPKSLDRFFSEELIDYSAGDIDLAREHIFAMLNRRLLWHSEQS